MIVESIYLALVGLGACRSIIGGGLKAGLFSLHASIWRWPRSRNHRAVIKSF